MIAPSVPSTLIGRSEQCLDLHTRDEVHLCPCEALAGNSQHAQDLGGMGWCFERGIAKEGVDRGEAQVATKHPHFILVFFSVARNKAKKDEIAVRRKVRLPTLSFRCFSKWSRKLTTRGASIAWSASRAGGVCSC